MTLYVPEPWRSTLDASRRVLDPIQASLIGAHVTLCREDEIESLDSSAVFTRVEAWVHGPLRLTFGRCCRFNGHGVLLPCVRGARQFRMLRQWVLQDQGVREHQAHITMAHPRNPRAAGNTEAALRALPEVLQLDFDEVTLIEQQGSAAWTVLKRSTLGGDSRGAR